MVIFCEYLFTLQAPICMIIMNLEIDSKLPCWMQELFKLVKMPKENQHKVSTRANMMSVMLMKITDNQIIDLAKSQKALLLSN